MRPIGDGIRGNTAGLPAPGPRAASEASEARKKHGLGVCRSLSARMRRSETGRPGSSQSLNRGGRLAHDTAATWLQPAPVLSPQTRGRIGHDRRRSCTCPRPRILRRRSRAIEPPDRGLRRPYAGARPGVPGLPEGDGGPGDGRALSQVLARGQERALYALTPRGTQDPSPAPGLRSGDSVGEYPRPRHIHAARIAARAARRAGARLHHRLPDPRVLPLRRARGGRSTRLLPGPERDGVRALPRARGPDDACRVDPDVHPGRGHRGAGVRGQPTRSEGRDDREPRAPPAGDGEGRRSDRCATSAYWIDNLSLDSQFDYDPFWTKCVELGITPTAHSVHGRATARAVR